jgi:hypothetical protein
MKRYIDEQLAHFIAFIQSPRITTDIPFGERKPELDSGEEITVPDVIRKLIHLRSLLNTSCTVKRRLTEIDSKGQHHRLYRLFSKNASCRRVKV